MEEEEIESNIKYVLAHATLKGEAIDISKLEGVLDYQIIRYRFRVEENVNRISINSKISYGDNGLENLWNISDSLLDDLVAHYDLLKSAGVEEIAFFLVIGFRNQCNWELPVEQVQKLAAINAVFAFSTYVASKPRKSRKKTATS